MKQIHWAIIGCGVISQSHLDAVAALPDATIYAVCDVDAARAEKKRAEFGAQKVYTDYHALLADPAVDVVSICTPSGMHAEMAIAAARAGKHIFCEKPMDVTAEKMSAMIDAIERAGVKCGCVFQRRTYPEARAVHDFIAQHDLGPVIFAEARLKYYRDQAYYDSGDWRATWELDGGGALMNQGVHGVDLLRWLAGDVESVSAQCRTLARNIDVEDAAAAVVCFKNGAIGTIRGTTCVYPAQETQISLHFKEGTIIFGDAGVTCFEFLDPALKIPPVTSLNANVTADPTKIGALSHLALARDLADAIREDRAPLITPQEARKSVDLILAIYRSSREGRTITL